MTKKIVSDLYFRSKVYSYYVFFDILKLFPFSKKIYTREQFPFSCGYPFQVPGQIEPLSERASCGQVVPPPTQRPTLPNAGVTVKKKRLSVEKSGRLTTVMQRVVVKPNKFKLRQEREHRKVRLVASFRHQTKNM